MHDGLLVIDADAHKMENPMVFFDYLDAPYRGRLASRTDRHGQPRLVIRDVDPRTGRPELERVFPQPEGPGKGAFAAIHPETAIGGVFNRIRIEHMDREGIDAQVLYGSMTLSFEAILDPELAVACMRAYNRYIADDCRAWHGRLFPVGFISLADVGEAVREVRRCIDELGMIGVHLPPSVPVPHPEARDAFPRIRLPKHLCHPDFHPVLAAAAELDVAVGVHGSPGVYLPSGIAEQVDTFILSHIFGHRNQMQMALATCVFEGLFDRFPTLRLGFLEAGCGWLPDLVHAFHEHWEKRIRDFDPSIRMPRGRFASELLRERVGADAQAPSLAQAAPGGPPLPAHLPRAARGRHRRLPLRASRPGSRPGRLFPPRTGVRQLRVRRSGARVPARGARRVGRGRRVLQRRLRSLGRRADRLRAQRRPRPAVRPRAPAEAARGQLPALLRAAAGVGGSGTPGRRGSSCRR